MDTQTLFVAGYEVALSLFFGLLTVFMAIRVLHATFLRDVDIREENLATSLFAGATVLCVLILVQASVLPSVDALRSMVLGHNQVTAGSVAVSLGYFLLFYTISLVLGIAVVLLATQIYMVATVKIDELAELKGNNLGVAVILCSVLVGTTLFVRAPVQRLLASLVDYDALERSSVEPAPRPGPDEVYMVPVPGEMPQGGERAPR